MIDEKLKSDIADELAGFMSLLSERYKQEQDAFIAELIRARMHKADSVYKELIGDSCLYNYSMKEGGYL